MNTLNIILLSCSLAVTVAQKVGDTSNDIIDGQTRNTGGYGLLRPGLQGGYNQGGYNQGGYNQAGYNQAGYNQGGYNQGGYNQGGYNQGYNGGYGGAQGGYGQGYGGYQGFGQGYGGNQGYGGGTPGLYPGAGLGGYPGGFGGRGGYGGRFGGSPSGFGQGYPGYGGSGSGYRPNPYKPGFDYNRNGFPELEYPGQSQYRPYVDRPISTPYNYHTGTYPTAFEDRYKYSDNINRYLGRKAGEIKEGEEKS